MPEYDNLYHFNKAYIDEPKPLGEMSLIQLGRMHCHGKTVVGEHLHREREYYELTVVTDGAGIITTNRVPIPVTKGQIYLSLPCDLHRIESDREDPLKFDFLSFSAEEPTIREEMRRIARTCTEADQRMISDERISMLVGDAIAELSTPEPFSDAILEAILRQIAWYLIRDFKSLSEKRERPKVKTPNELCYQMMHYIDTHLYTMSNLSELSQEFRYNYSYLSALYRSVTGDTLRQYYCDRRLEAARLLLEEGNLSVGEVAELLHYSSIYTFSRAFKDRYRFCPSAARANRPEPEHPTDRKET